MSTHLKPGGIFIFDMNTLEKVERLAAISPLVTHQDSRLTTILELCPVKNALYEWKFTVFEQLEGVTYRKIESSFMESVYTKKQVDQALDSFFNTRSWFAPETVLKNRISFDQLGRLYALCQR